MKNKTSCSVVILCGGMSKRMGEDKGSMLFNKKPMILHLLDMLDNQIDEVFIVLNNSNRIEKYKKLIEKFNRENKKNPYTYDLIFLEDEIKDQGPLSGIMTGLKNINSDYCLILPCDSPQITENFINQMFSMLNKCLFSDFSKIKDYPKTFLNFYHDESNDFLDIEAIVPYHNNSNDSLNSELYLNKKTDDFNEGSNLNDSSKERDNFDYYDNILNNSEPLHSIFKKDSSEKIEKYLKSNIRDVKSLLKNSNSCFIQMNNENSFKNFNKKEDIYNS